MSVLQEFANSQNLTNYESKVELVELIISCSSESEFESFIFKRKKRTKVKLLGIITIIATIIGLMVDLPELHKKVSNQEDIQEKPISISEEQNYCTEYIGNDSVNFNISILQFYNPDSHDKSKCIGESLFIFLSNDSMIKNSNIGISYCPNIKTPLNLKDAEDTRRLLRCDFLIYGLYNQKYSSGCNNLDVCFQYLTKSDTLLPTNVDVIYDDIIYNTSSSKDIIEGYISADYRDVALWMYSIDKVKKYEYLESIIALESISSSEILNDISYQIEYSKSLMLSNKFYKCNEYLKDKYDKAYRLFSTYCHCLIGNKDKEAIRLLDLRIDTTKGDYLKEDITLRSLAYSKLNEYDQSLEDLIFLEKEGYNVDGIKLRRSLEESNLSLKSNEKTRISKSQKRLRGILGDYKIASDSLKILKSLIDIETSSGYTDTTCIRTLNELHSIEQSRNIIIKVVMYLIRIKEYKKAISSITKYKLEGEYYEKLLKLLNQRAEDTFKQHADSLQNEGCYMEAIDEYLLLATDTLSKNEKIKVLLEVYEITAFKFQNIELRLKTLEALDSLGYMYKHMQRDFVNLYMKTSNYDKAIKVIEKNFKSDYWSKVREHAIKKKTKANNR